MLGQLPFNTLLSQLEELTTSVASKDVSNIKELRMPLFICLKSLLKSLSGIEFLFYRTKTARVHLAIGKQRQFFDYEALRIFQQSYSGKIYGHRQFEPLQKKLQGWQDLSAISYFVPLLEIETDEHGKGELALPLLADPKTLHAALLELASQLQNTNEAPQAQMPSSYSSRQTPKREVWIAKVKNVVQENLSEGTLQKVALAKKTTLEFNRPLDLASVIELFWNENPANYFILYAYSPERLFVSFTPETLFKVSKGVIELDALAGTRPRSLDEAQDNQLQTELLNSPKDLSEHQYVVDEICQGLSLVAKNLSLSGPKIKKLKKVQHLLTSCQATLSPEVLMTDLLHLFHPTPAVGGLPRSKALAVIAENEVFSRGLYAAPIGFFDKDQADFAVALRCFDLHSKQLEMYAGVGLVADSVAEQEWQETEDKLAELMERLSAFEKSEIPVKEIAPTAEGALHA